MLYICFVVVENCKQNAKESVGMGNEEERNTRSFGQIGEGAQTRVRVDSELSEEFEVNVGTHRGSALSLFAVMVVVGVKTPQTSEDDPQKH